MAGTILVDSEADDTRNRFDYGFNWAELQYCRKVRLNRPLKPRSGGAVPGTMRVTP